MNDPREMIQLFRHFPAADSLAVYPSAGNPKEQGGRFIYEAGPNRFADAVPELVAKGARLIGGCCGTTPWHIAALARAIAKLPRR